MDWKPTNTFLKGRITMYRSKRSTTYNKIFRNMMQTGKPVKCAVDDYGDCLTGLKAEDFRQCYVPKNSDAPFAKARNMLPKYWFLDRKGHLLSVADKKNCVWISPQKDRVGTYLIKHKKISSAALQLLVYADEACMPATPYATERINKLGLKAFGSKNDEDIQVDHRLSDRIRYFDGTKLTPDETEKNCNLDYIWFCSKGYNGFFNVFDRKIKKTYEDLSKKSENNSVDTCNNKLFYKAISDWLRDKLKNDDTFKMLLRESGGYNKESELYKKVTRKLNNIINNRRKPPKYYIRVTSFCHWLKIGVEDTDELCNFQFYNTLFNNPDTIPNYAFDSIMVFNVPISEYQNNPEKYTHKGFNPQAINYH